MQKTKLNLPSYVKGHDEILGLDADGDLVVRDGTIQAVLTGCCYSYGKGSEMSETYVCCRRCYEDVDEKYGGGAEVVTPADALEIVFFDAPVRPWK